MNCGEKTVRSTNSAGVIGNYQYMLTASCYARYEKREAVNSGSKLHDFDAWVPTSLDTISIHAGKRSYALYAPVVNSFLINALPSTTPTPSPRYG
ncbi:hypothetical protein FRB94_012473 [Tulasnella sp. JGI-2019a]|nr:hypothetical protein FRB93_010317 [Tulasnella sp. JGI-2019a]KAG8991480.1 hypothetical protein FRB94_012473 [Tulasnella sp. JGI-2019a]